MAYPFVISVINRRDEMGKLAHTFNEMLAGLRSRRELEEKLQRAERSALTGRIASGIAHEIRNPLSFINLTVDYVRDRFAPAAAGPRADYTQLLDNVKSEIARLNQMVSDFLSFGRPARLIAVFKCVRPFEQASGTAEHAERTEHAENFQKVFSVFSSFRVFSSP